MDRGRDTKRTHKSLSPPKEIEMVHNVDEIDLIPDLPERLEDLDQFMKDEELEKIFEEGMQRM